MSYRELKSKSDMKKIEIWILSLFFAILAGLCSYKQVFNNVDHQITDAIFQSIDSTSDQPKIKIIAIDDDTVDKYGNSQNWSRMHLAELVNRLNASKQDAPKVIGIDFNLDGAKDPTGDQALTKTCEKYKNVCAGVNFSMGRNVYDSLESCIEMGSLQDMKCDSDGFFRKAKKTETINGQRVDTFAYVMYKMYRHAMGKEAVSPKVDADGDFIFRYSHKSEEYKKYCFYDVVTGKIKPEVFKDSIVLIGDYTKAGYTFHVPNQRNTKMNGIEIQANILEALIDQKTGQEVPRFLIAIVVFFYILVYCLVTFNIVDWRHTLHVFSLVILLLGAGILCCYLGYYVLIFVPIVFMLLASASSLVMRYVAMYKKKKEMEEVFKKYVDENIVNTLVEGGAYEAKIGGIRKDIAVLFVDIRGFTTLSESRNPEEIVDILNLYLSRVSTAISKNHGTLDKFIGDAAMAVFNSPNDLEDYENWAVCAAWDIQACTEELNQLLQEKYGVEIQLGVGVHCGEAVIGNIGCETHMDFTAIGDTVNTASRLEGVAEAGQILISEELRSRIPDVAEYLSAGEYSLKGKKKKIMTYSVAGQPSKPVIMEIRTPSREISLEKRKEEILQKTEEIRMQGIVNFEERQEEIQKRREALRRKLEANRLEAMKGE